MKLTEQQIWKCNNTEDGGVYICLEHQNVVDFARAIERELEKHPPLMVVSQECAERGCVAHDDRVDGPGVVIGQREPLGYWNAVEGWVELPEEAHKPTAWVYPEALEAFRQGKPWTAYGLSGEGYSGSDGIKRIPIYTTPPAAQRQWVGLSEEEIDKLKHLIDWTATWSHGRFAYEIEQLLKEKNA